MHYFTKVLAYEEFLKLAPLQEKNIGAVHRCDRSQVTCNPPAPPHLQKCAKLTERIGIGANIRTHQEIQCLPYAGFSVTVLGKAGKFPP